MKCHPRAYAKCPDCHSCGSLHEAFFMEGSECDAFNQVIKGLPLTMGDKVRCMNNNELAKAAAEEIAKIYAHTLAIHNIGISATQFKVVEHKAYYHYLNLFQMTEEEYNANENHPLPRL